MGPPLSGRFKPARASNPNRGDAENDLHCTYLHHSTTLLIALGLKEQVLALGRTKMASTWFLNTRFECDPERIYFKQVKEIHEPENGQVT